MQNTRSEHYLQWLYAYLMMILGSVAIGASVGQAGGGILIDSLLAKPSGQHDHVPVQGAQVCSENTGLDWQNDKLESADLAKPGSVRSEFAPLN